MHQNKISVLSVDEANGIFICEDGSEYPLLEGLERMEPDEIQEHVNTAMQITDDIVEKLNDLYGQATDIERDDATA
jgi:hypothetical protein